MTDIKKGSEEKEMRFLLFYGAIESLNHFTNELNTELRKRGHSTFVVDMCQEELDFVEALPDGNIDCAVCYDCVGTFGKELYDEKGITVVNILMDHPMNLAFCMRNPPEKYIQLSPDENHVVYAKRFFSIENVFFMPHMASLCTEFHQIPYEKKSIEILFPGSVCSCNALYEQIKERWYSESSLLLALSMLEYLLENPEKTLEEALYYVLLDRDMELSDPAIAAFMEHSKAIDSFVRMYHRERVLIEIARSGIPVTIIGNGWENLALAQWSNVTIGGGRSFEEIFPYMERAKITLTVMPWFKAGTHDRIFNALMHYSCPLTDDSSWLLEHFKPDEECAYYSLKRLEDIPYKIYQLLNHPEMQQRIISNGRDKVLNNYTTSQIVDQILQHLKECYGQGKELQKP
ncbi:MAG: glycosyltransferase [Lachnospiraceae bacterium]|nr:glycosyltransferase [Butyrivibrio sp.]MCM1342411.1 glycosyltransferase [Muribaculaceae bacterium]MCM1410282.1 glycosyltransferase [Lachnospiraceae bacterium]